ncbi:MAG: Asp23/Gls24 family envelope stress response protein [Firmicutes bacterium]|nr:Asp23/Gls24 family envelope stress response protein [Bacillota bacterium]
MGNDKQDLLKISKEVVSMAASKATLNVPGVNQEKGLKITSTKEGFVIDVHVIADFGVKIPQLAWDIQNSVKEAVISAANVAVKVVNIHIQGVMMPREGSNING